METSAKTSLESMNRQERRDWILAYLEQNHCAWDVVKVRAEQFAEMVLDKYENAGDLQFHVRRSCGFGGSSQGTLVANRHGNRGDFQAEAADVVAQVQLRELSRSYGKDFEEAVARGHLFEPVVRSKFMEKYEHLDIKRFNSALEKTANHRGPLPFMRYSADDLVVCKLEGNPWGITEGYQGLIFVLVDYKAPGEVEYDDFGRPEVKESYRTQLHAGKMFFESAGIPIHGMVLAQYDYKKSGSVQSKGIADRAVEFDQGLAARIIEANQHYFNEYVLKDRVPARMQFPDTLSLKNIDPQEVERVVKELNELTHLDYLYKALGKLISAKRSKVGEVFESIPVEGAAATLKLGNVTVKSTGVVDNDALVELLKSKGRFEECLETKLNGTRVNAVLKELGAEAPLNHNEARKIGFDNSRDLAKTWSKDLVEQVNERISTMLKSGESADKAGDVQSDDPSEAEFVAPKIGAA